jgi:GABA permease
LKVWLHPWLNVFLIVCIAAVVGIMLTSEGGRTQVWTSLVATGVLVLFWPLVRRNLARRSRRTESESDPEDDLESVTRAV